MLEENPYGADRLKFEFWRDLKPMTVEMLGKYWEKVEPKTPFLDLMHGDCAFWEEGF